MGMYEFIDTTEYQDDTVLPAEAVRFNGKWLDNEVAGFRTLCVSGRELMPCEVTDEQIGNTDGTQYQYKRYPARQITVTYQLTAKNDTLFRDAFNKLNGLLDVEEGELVFNDEPDKYFVATKTANSEVPPGRNSVTGEIIFYCTDPLKHSTVEKVFPASPNADGILEATIVNNGTESVPVSYEIVHNHENGYIGIVSEYGVMQYGYIEEPDTEVRQKSQVLLNYKNAADFSGMAVNTGRIIPAKIPQNGSFKTVTADGKTWLALDDPGNNPSYYAGASRCITLPADSSGHVGAKNFKFQMKVWFETVRVTQTGIIYIALADSAGKEIAMMNLQKFTTGNNTAECYMHADTGLKCYKCVRWEPGYWSVTNKDRGLIAIQKHGGLFEFTFGGQKYPMRCDALADAEVTQVIILLGQWKNRGNTGNLVGRMYVGEMLFQSDAVDYVYNIPNRYREGSVCTADGNAAKFYVDGVPSLEDERKGTDYFHVPPGETKVLFTHSDFSNPPPSITARIREAYL